MYTDIHTLHIPHTAHSLLYPSAYTPTIQDIPAYPLLYSPFPSIFPIPCIPALIYDPLYSLYRKDYPLSVYPLFVHGKRISPCSPALDTLFQPIHSRYPVPAYLRSIPCSSLSTIYTLFPCSLSLSIPLPKQSQLDLYPYL